MKPDHKAVGQNAGGIDAHAEQAVASARGDMKPQNMAAGDRLLFLKKQLNFVG